MTSVYTFLGPEGTFTEAALLQVTGAEDVRRIPASNVEAALDAVRSGEAGAAMVPIENSVEGGVSATLDAIAGGEPLQIIGEQLVPIRFVLAVRPGTERHGISVVSTHPHAWAQCRNWCSENIPHAAYLPASSTAAAGVGLLDPDAGHQAAICSPLVAQQRGLQVLADDIGDIPDAVTRFILVSRPGALPAPTGADKTTLVVPLPQDHPGALVAILEQLSSRGVNLSRIESRPTGQFLGDYFFSLDAEGHLAEERVADAVRGLHRLSPGLRFLGSYPRADRRGLTVPRTNQDEAFLKADGWVRKLLQAR